MDEDDYDLAVLDNVVTWPAGCTPLVAQVRAEYRGHDVEGNGVMYEHALKPQRVSVLGTRRKMLKTFEIVRREENGH